MRTARYLSLLLAWLTAQTAGAGAITVTSTADSGLGTLREALAGASDGDMIDATGVSGTILLTSGELLVSNSVTIIGPGPGMLAVDGDAASRVFHIGSNAVVTITGLTITNGLATTATLIPWAMGGGVYSYHATLTISNCILSGNLSTNSSFFGGSGIFYGDGGGIYNDHGRLMVNDCVLTGNQAGSGSGSGSYGGHGGGICNGGLNGGATAIIVNSTLSGNIANADGGGIYSEGGTLIVAGSIVSGNSNFFNSGGGGIGVYSGTVTVSNCAFAGNAGGGIQSEGTLTMVNSMLSGNSATYGGGIENMGQAAIANCTFIGNSALYLGGGIRNAGTLAMDNSTLSSNSAANPAGADGGGIENEGTLTIAHSTLSGNSAPHGGGIFNNGRYNSNAIVNLSDTILDAGGSGVSITNDSGTVASLGYNLSSDDGGGFLTATGDQINTDPMLGPLQDNGGPTFTHALLCGSPAIDQGFSFSGSTADQRGAGFARTFDDPTVANAPGGDGTDIGAYEVQPGVCAPLDSDGDGVPDAIDQCPATPGGAVVDAAGCSIGQLVPCEGPLAGGTWRSHGQYVRAVIEAATDFLRAGLITRRQWARIVTEAARSRCGWNRRWDHEWDRDWHRNWDCDRDRDWGRGRDRGRN